LKKPESNQQKRRPSRWAHFHFRVTRARPTQILRELTAEAQRTLRKTLLIKKYSELCARCVSYENADWRQKSPGPAARPLYKRKPLGDLSALLRTTASHFHPLCCTNWYMNYSVLKYRLLLMCDLFLTGQRPKQRAVPGNPGPDAQLV
jgi:hypothetical protein